MQHVLYGMIATLKHLLITATFTIATNGYVCAQQGYWQLIKNDKFLRNYMSGSVFKGWITGSEYIEAVVLQIRNDSAQLRPFYVRQLSGFVGDLYLDTSYTNTRWIARTDVEAVPRLKPRSGLSIPGILMLGGLGYSVVNVVNSLSRNAAVFGKENIVRLGIAVGAMAVGYVWMRSRDSDYQMGKRYTLRFVPMTQK